MINQEPKREVYFEVLHEETDEYSSIEPRATMLVSIKRYEFTIGICASDTAARLRELLMLIQSEKFPEELLLCRIVIVASGCPTSTIEFLHEFAMRDRRLLLIKEEARHGKAEAINRIIENSVGDYLLFVNSDAIPATGAMSAILRTLGSNGLTGVVSGRPFFDWREGHMSKILQLMWLVHNECAETLNHMAIGNHGSDELMAVRSKLLEPIPQGLVNDGAYISGRAKLRGYLVKFCGSAGVEIDVPNSIVDTISQRRRIIFGHFQIWKLTGKSPRTVGSLLVSSPLLGARIVVKTVARFPRLVWILPAALVEEMVAFSLAVMDTLVSTDRHGVWKRYGK